MGKGEIARYEQFLFSQQCFQKSLLQTRENQGIFLVLFFVLFFTTFHIWKERNFLLAQQNG